MINIEMMIKLSQIYNVFKVRFQIKFIKKLNKMIKIKNHKFITLMIQKKR
jgi:hypothetical protein